MRANIVVLTAVGLLARTVTYGSLEFTPLLTSSHRTIFKKLQF